MEKKDKKKGHNAVVILLNLAAMLIITVFLLVFVFRWIKNYTRHGQHIEVPTLTGMDQESAAAALAGTGLTLEVSDFRYEASAKEGEIVEQHPKAGSYVKEGRIIYLTINTGRIPTKPVPDVADNSSLRAAESKLRAAGFRLTEPEYIPGDLDWVYELKYNDRTIRRGEELPEGSLITIVVGNGDPDMEIEEVDQSTTIDSEFFQD